MYLFNLKKLGAFVEESRATCSLRPEDALEGLQSDLMGTPREDLSEEVIVIGKAGHARLLAVKFASCSCGGGGGG